MLKINNKQVRESVRKYIMNNLEEITPQELWDSFINEKVKYDKSNKPYQELFQDWLMGLPSGFDVDYINEYITATLMNWLQQTQQEADKYDIFKQVHLYCYLIYSELQKMVEAHY